MHVVEMLQSNAAAFIALTAVLGLFIGSFLNVVAHRLPIVMERQWQEEAREVLGQEALPPGPVYNLAWPGSSCPHCNHGIRPHENVPVLSYLLLKGRCSRCSSPIARRYPLVEAGTAMLSVIIALRFGFSLQAAGVLVLAWFVIGLSLIDLEHQLLPDCMTLPLIWLGLIINTGHLYASLPDAVFGAAAGYLSLWLINLAYKALRNQDGIGGGDAKLLAALGAWCGWQMLPHILIVAAVAGLVVNLLLQLARKDQEIPPVAFGPYLATAGLAVMLAGSDQLTKFLQLSI